ncbi:glycosyltransferase family 2 protein [Limimaricola pyoseonensis]|uniref:Glycosyltransferase, GT2 family n=1 Tax=Limimaricola pyoseonensis TaxID=521013 RepID=A0A1G7ET58_9RHOB|nr:glycosyltransferase [Limimaricola pyoseonensis]SDE66792.1 Glycosyltransferase, GT2 family [Limimaricola pyoseonensis]
MSPARVSVVVVSRGRPAALRLCLMALSQQRHPAYEVIVVADPEGLAAVSHWHGRIRMVACDEPNIGLARNLGIAAAAGGIVAFIDDDALAEPSWLERLVAPFEDPAVEAAGGFVRGPSGWAYQWRARAAFADATTRDLPLEDETPVVLRGRLGRGVKTEGTNMAVRRERLAAMGGFDPAYRYYLDETDLNMRLAALGACTAIVPLAQVHHGYLPSPRRRADRVPRDLSDIGASLAVFLRRHAARIDGNARIEAERLAQRERLLHHLHWGRIAPGDVGRLLESFDAGVSAGRTRPLGRLAPIDDAPPAFLPMHDEPPEGPHLWLSAWPWEARARLGEAAPLVAAGHVVTLCVLWPDARRHRLRLDPSGVWIQSGGLFGPAWPDDPRVGPWRFAARSAAEAERCATLRGAVA